MSKHYIKLDSEGRIIKGFSDDFEQPATDDICINEQGGMQFEMLGKINPTLFRFPIIPMYKYENGSVINRTEEEIQADKNSLPVQISEIERIEAIEAAITVLMGV